MVDVHVKPNQSLIMWSAYVSEKASDSVKCSVSGPFFFLLVL